MPLAELATAAWGAMWKLYDQKYGKTAKQIKALRRDLLEAQGCIDTLREQNAAGRALIAKMEADAEQMGHAVQHWVAKYHSLSALLNERTMEPRPLDPNPYEDDDEES